MAMAKAVNEAQIWLPSQFLTDADILGDKENNNNVVNTDLDASFGFPTEFPYEFDSFGGSSSALSSPVESVAGSTETDSNGSDVDEDFFAALTRRLGQSSLYETSKLAVPTERDKTEFVKAHGLARSPQSTLSGIRSPSVGSQVPSPPTTPFPPKNDLAWDVIYAAAGQVARLKMTAEISKYNLQNSAFLSAIPKTQASPPPPSLYSNQSLLQAQLQARQQQCGSVWGRQAKANWLVQQQQKMQNRVVRNVGYESVKCGRPVSLSQSTWPPVQVQAHNTHQQVQFNGSGQRAAVNGGGSGGRRGCGGTGVFLPRQYGNPPEIRKKTSCAPVLLPSRVVHGRNLKTDDLNAVNQTGFSGAFATEYDVLLARRNALLMQQQRLSVRAEEAVNHDLRLPQDWIY